MYKKTVSKKNYEPIILSVTSVKRIFICNEIVNICSVYCFII